MRGRTSQIGTLKVIIISFVLPSLDFHETCRP